MAQTNSFQEAAEKWLALSDEADRAHDEALHAQTRNVDCANKLIEHETTMAEFVGQNITEKAAVVGEFIVIAAYNDRPRKVPKS